MFIQMKSVNYANNGAVAPGSRHGWGGERFVMSPKWLHPSGCNAGRKKEPFLAVWDGRGNVACEKGGLAAEG